MTPVTVCVLSRNTLADTRRCLEHLLAFTDVPFRLVALDNGSTDGTADYLRALAAAGACDVRAVCLPGNIGFAPGVNRCAEEAIPDSHLALVNSDVLVGPHWASRLQAHLADTGRVAAVGPLGRAFGNRQEFISRYGPPAFVDRVPPGPDYLAFVESWYRLRRGDFSTSKYLLGACVLLSAPAVAELGLLDATMVFGADDFDWSLRARLRGYDLVVAEDVYVWHAGGATRQRFRQEFDRLNADAWARFTRKWSGVLPAGVSWERLWLDDADLAHPPFRYQRNYEPGEVARTLRGR